MAQYEPLDYAKAACETMMRKFCPEDLPPKGHFHYHQGVFLSGVCKTAALCKEERYWNYAADWLRSVFTPDGKIRDYAHADLDDIQPGILLFLQLDRDAEHAEFWRAAIESVAAQVPDIPRCACGGLYHKVNFTQQMWLDGLYMACPFMTEYDRRFGRPEFTELAVQDIFLMREHTCDAATGLWRHAWDESHQAPWCDPETGLAPEVWGRSVGWVPVAVQDVLAQLPAGHPDRTALEQLVRDLLAAVCRCQSEDGRWYQVLDKGGQPGNWLENSCSCLFAAALARAVRTGVLSREWLAPARRAFEGVARSLTWQGEDLQIGNVCIGTGVGDYQFYCDRPTSTNDLHGVGAFLLMCTELAQAEAAV